MTVLELAGWRLSVATTTAVAARLTTHLRRPDGQEDVCFVLWRPGTGTTRTTALVYDLVLPAEGEREVHGNASFSDTFFLRAAGLAAEAGAGLGLIHSHPRGQGWQRLSPDDHKAEAGHAGQSIAITGLPLLGLTLAGSDDAISARMWERAGTRSYRPHWCDNVRIVGDRISVSWNPATCPPPATEPTQVRTVSAWGPKAQADMARLHVGIVGAGSVGNLVGEALARMGIRRYSILDFDVVESLNLDRLLHATRPDAQLGRPKAEVLARGMRGSATARDVRIDVYEVSVVEPDGMARALDCDVIFSCVDRPWPRAVLNLLAYAHLVPVIDGGLRIQTTRSNTMRGAAWRSHLAAPGRACLECLGQYDPADVALERTGLLDDPVYVAGLDEQHTLRRIENVFPFSMATAADEVLELIRAVVAPGGVSDVGAQLHHFPTGHVDHRTEGCHPRCPYSGYLLASGDGHELRVTGPHAAAHKNGR